LNDQLTLDHEELGTLLGEVRNALAAGDISQSHSRLDFFWARLAMHIRAEHLHLFPAILGQLNKRPNVNIGVTPSLAQAQKIIQELRGDHEFFMHELASAIAILRDLLKNKDQLIAARKLEAIGAATIAVERRLAIHNLLEETEVYLWTRNLLSDAEQTALAARIQSELNNVPPRFSDAATVS
jgi:hypothetical protein